MIVPPFLGGYFVCFFLFLFRKHVLTLKPSPRCQGWAFFFRGHGCASGVDGVVHGLFQVFPGEDSRSLTCHA